MKKIIISISLLALSLLSANAQVKFGIKGGANYGTISNYDNVSVPSQVGDVFKGEGDSKYRFGFNAGAFVNFAVGGGVLAFQPEVLYSNQGMKNSGKVEFLGQEVSYSSTTKLDYLNVPVMIQIYIIPEVLNIEVGPQVGFLLKSQRKMEYNLNDNYHYDNTDDIDDIKDIDFSIAAGVGFQIPGLPIGVNARYTIGLTEVDKNADKNDNKKTYNSVLQFGAFLKF